MSRTASFCFSDDLKMFLAPPRRTGDFGYAFQAGQTVKHLVESFGVPHTEIGRVEVNGVTVNLDYQVQDNDQVAIYPPLAGSRPAEQHVPLSFLLDNHLGRLAVYLRMLGLDAWYMREAQDAELARLAHQNHRILLTRDRRLLMRKEVSHGYCLRSKDPVEQAGEVLYRFGLQAEVEPFHRCLRCNSVLQTVSKKIVLHRLEPLTKRYFEQFHLCPLCDQIYWKGSHYEHMQSIIAAIQERAQR